MRDIGKNIRDARLSRSLTQQQLAEMLGLTHQALSGYETGRRRASLEQLQMIAKALDIDMRQLLYGEALPRRISRCQLRRLLAGVLFYLLLFYGADMGEYLLSPWMRKTYGFTFPLLSSLRQIAQPPALLLLGWTVMQALHTLGLLPPLRLPCAKRLRCCVGFLLLAYWILQVVFWRTFPCPPQWLATIRRLLWLLRPLLGGLLWATQDHT